MREFCYCFGVFCWSVLFPVELFPLEMEPSFPTVAHTDGFDLVGAVIAWIGALAYGAEPLILGNDGPTDSASSLDGTVHYESPILVSVYLLLLFCCNYNIFSVVFKLFSVNFTDKLLIFGESGGAAFDCRPEKLVCVEGTASAHGG